MKNILLALFFLSVTIISSNSTELVSGKSNKEQFKLSQENISFVFQKLDHETSPSTEDFESDSGLQFLLNKSTRAGFLYFSKRDNSQNDHNKKFINRCSGLSPPLA